MLLAYTFVVLIVAVITGNVSHAFPTSHGCTEAQVSTTSVVNGTNLSTVVDYEPMVLPILSRELAERLGMRLPKQNASSGDDLAPIRQSIESESNVPRYVSEYVTANLEELVVDGLAGYASTGALDQMEKFKQAGQNILKNRILSGFTESGHWEVVADVPPGPVPQKGDGTKPPYLISISIPAGFRGVVKEAGRLRFECVADCFPENTGWFGK